MIGAPDSAGYAGYAVPANSPRARHPLHEPLHEVPRQQPPPPGMGSGMGQGQMGQQPSPRRGNKTLSHAGVGVGGQYGVQHVQNAGGGIEELGAMRVAPPSYSDAPHARPKVRRDRGGRAVGLGLASNIHSSSEWSSQHAESTQRTAFAPNSLFADTMRRREKVVGARRSPRRQHGGNGSEQQLAVAHGAHGGVQAGMGFGGEPLMETSREASAHLDASISSIEHSYSRMDRSLLSELTHIARDEMVEPFDATQNRQLRTELAHWIHSSRQRVGSLNFENFDEATVTPTSARAALKEGSRMPLELVRSEMRVRNPHRRQPHPEAADPAGATELPAMA